MMMFLVVVRIVVRVLFCGMIIMLCVDALLCEVRGALLILMMLVLGSFSVVSV